MKFRVARDEFADSVAWVARSLPSRPPVPVLGCVVLNVGDTGLTVSGFDYEVSAQENLGAEVAEPGQVLVSGRLLADITKALPNKPVDVTLDGARVAITCGSAKFSLPTMPVEDYPQLPDIPAITGTIPSQLFAEAISQVAVAAGKDDTLPMLTGMRLEISGETLTMVATDRFRLAMKEFTWKPADGVTDAAVLVPAKTLSEAARSLGSAGTTVRLGLSSGEGMLGLAGADRHTTTRLLDAEFPPYRKLLPSQYTSRAELEVPALTEAIKRVSLVAERGTQVRLEFSEGSLKLAAGGDDEGSAEEELPVAYEGEPVIIAFNPGYLLDGLSALPSDRAELTFTTPNRPALIKPLDDEGKVAAGYLYLLMPVRLPG